MIWMTTARLRRWMHEIFYELMSVERTELSAKINTLRALIENPIACETCGCLVHKDYAIKGSSFIRTSKGEFAFPPKEYIHTPYYCRCCWPGGES